MAESATKHAHRVFWFLVAFCSPDALSGGVEEGIAALAERQFGVVSRRQLLESGLSSSQIVRWLRAGKLTQVHPSTYRISGAPESWHQAVMAACLWGREDATASHASAGRLWGLDGFEATRAVEITVPVGRYTDLEGVLVHRTRRLHARDRAFVGEIPVTRVERTLIDIALTADTETLEIATESAIRRGFTTTERLAWRVEDHWGKHGLRPLRYFIRLQQEKPSKSRWEVRLRRLIREAGLPEPVREFSVWDGETMRELDLSYPEALIGIEYDSYRWHSGRQQWERTHTRTANLVSWGWTILPVTMDDIELRPRETIEKIRRILSRAGVI